MRLNVLLAVLAAAVLAAFVVLYFVMTGDSNGGAENGLAVEDQSPIIEQKPAEETMQTADETSAPMRQEDTPVLEESTASEESAASSGDSGSAGAAQPDAPQAAPKDPLTLELQDALEEFAEFADTLRSRFPNNPMSMYVADVVGRLSVELTRYDAQLLSQNLTREERIAKLKERAEQITDQADEPDFDMDDPALAASMEELESYGAANMPTKLTTLLGLDW